MQKKTQQYQKAAELGYAPEWILIWTIAISLLSFRKKEEKQKKLTNTNTSINNL